MDPRFQISLLPVFFLLSAVEFVYDGMITTLAIVVGD